MGRSTVFQILVRERRWQEYEVFKRQYEKSGGVLARRGGQPGLQTATISRRQFMRWLNGQVAGVPRSEARRILEHMFQVPVEHLFQPATTDESNGPVAEAVQRQGSIRHGCDQHAGREEAVSMAAHESARFAARAEQTNVGPHTLEQLQVDIQRIVMTYPNRPLVPLFHEARELRNRAFELLEGKQPPQYTRDLYLAAGTLCGVLSNASFDLGQYGPAETQARTAFLCGELAGHNGLRAWVRGMQALIAYWDERPSDALRFAQSGQEFIPEEGTAHIRLACIAARALAKLGREDDALAALRLAGDQREAAERTPEDGGMMAFPEAKQLLYASTTHLWLGSLADAEHEATAAIESYEAAPRDQRRLGELSLARMDLAHARLGQDDLDGAAEQIDVVLGVEARRRTASVGRRLEQFGRRLALASSGSSTLGVNVLDGLATYHERRARELTSGDSA